jgi:hypothetical protein
MRRYSNTENELEKDVRNIRKDTSKTIENLLPAGRIFQNCQSFRASTSVLFLRKTLFIQRNIFTESHGNQHAAEDIRSIEHVIKIMNALTLSASKQPMSEKSEKRATTKAVESSQERELATVQPVLSTADGDWPSIVENLSDGFKRLVSEVVSSVHEQLDEDIILLEEIADFSRKDGSPPRSTGYRCDKECRRMCDLMYAKKFFLIHFKSIETKVPMELTDLFTIKQYCSLLEMGDKKCG